MKAFIQPAICLCKWVHFNYDAIISLCKAVNAVLWWSNYYRVLSIKSGWCWWGTLWCRLRGRGSKPRRYSQCWHSYGTAVHCFCVASSCLTLLQRTLHGSLIAQILDFCDFFKLWRKLEPTALSYSEKQWKTTRRKQQLRAINTTEIVWMLQYLVLSEINAFPIYHGN